MIGPGYKCSWYYDKKITEHMYFKHIVENVERKRISCAISRTMMNMFFGFNIVSSFISPVLSILTLKYILTQNLV